jgi:hypothetical protein
MIFESTLLHIIFGNRDEIGDLVENFPELGFHIFGDRRNWGRGVYGT